MTIRRTENYEFNRPKMSTQRRTTVYVEGRTDKVVFDRFVLTQRCKLERVDGKPKLMSILRSSHRRNEKGFAGIVDADYWLISNAQELATENLLYDSSFPDMETILLNSPALNAVISNILLMDNTRAVEDFVNRLSETGHRIAMEYGYFRWLEHCRQYGLPCNGVIERRIDKLVDLQTYRLRSRSAANLLSGNEDRVTPSQLLEEVDKLRRKQPADTILLCRGKDIVRFIAYILPSLFQERFGKTLSKAKRDQLKAESLSTQLRLVYDEMYFKDTSLRERICQWQEDNSPYRILRHPCPDERTAP